MFHYNQHGLYTIVKYITASDIPTLDFNLMFQFQLIYIVLCSSTTMYFLSLYCSKVSGSEFAKLFCPYWTGSVWPLRRKLRSIFLIRRAGRGHDGRRWCYTGGAREAGLRRRGVRPMGSRGNPTDSQVANEGEVLPARGLHLLIYTTAIPHVRHYILRRPPNSRSVRPHQGSSASPCVTTT